MEVEGWGRYRSDQSPPSHHLPLGWWKHPTSAQLYLYSNKEWRPILIRKNVEHYKVFCINYYERRARGEVAAGGNGRNYFGSFLPSVRTRCGPWWWPG